MVCAVLLAANMCMLLLAIFDHHANHHPLPASVRQLVSDTILLSLAFLASLFTYMGLNVLPLAKIAAKSKGTR